MDESEANPALLHASILARDEYISYLIREFRTRRPLTRLDWDALAKSPEDVTVRLQRLEQRLHVEIQKEELSLSLERARISREQVELQKVRTRLEKEIRRLGATAADKSSASDLNASNSDSGGWSLFRRKK
ncbi:MAG: hypothetical protein R3B90_18070 [Planctomycetaceae bacterium]